MPVNSIHERPFTRFGELSNDRGQPLHVAPLAFGEN
jgi:hypothetical protein